MRRSWVFLLVAIASAFCLVEGARTLVRIRAAVVPGVYFSRTLRVIAPIPEPARESGIELGDRITNVDEHRIDDADALAEYAASLGIDHPVELGLEGRGGAVRAALRTIAPSWATAWLRYAVGAAFVLIGLTVFWFHPGGRESWPFLLGCVGWGASALMGMAIPRTTHTRLDGRIGLFAYALAGPMLLHLFLVFPRPLRAVVRSPRLLHILDVSAVGAGACAALLAGSELGAGLSLFVLAAINGVVLVTILAIVVWRLRRAAPREDVVRLRALIVASIVAFPVPAALTLARVLGQTPSSDLQAWIGNLSSVLFPLIVAFAISRRDLFELDRAIARAAAASAVVGLVAVVVIAIAFGVPALIAPRSLTSSPNAMAIAVLIGTGLMWPVKLRVQRWLIDRFTPPDIADKVVALREALVALEGSAEPALFGRFERRLEEVVGVEDAALLLPETSGWRRPATGETLADVALPRLIELRVRDATVVALGLGRPGCPVVLSHTADRILAVLGPELARALIGRPAVDSLGGYRIDRFLAAGGMGNVYAGVKLGAGGFVKEVAIKQLLPELAVDPSIVERFLREARIVARLSHPGIVQTLELGEAERGYFIVMEYVHGLDAATMIRRLKRERERLPLAVAAYAVTSICRALDHVHRACDDDGKPFHVIHHDVSPHNILIDTDGNLKLADFGVARMRQDTPSERLLVGKVGYISPEQIAGAPFDHRIDVFAAGIVLYELVTLSHPFARGTEAATLRATEQGRYFPPETLREDCPDQLAQVIATALAPAERRYGTAGALADAIEQVFPLASRHAEELGRIVRSLQATDPQGSVRMPAVTASLPTVRG